MGGNGASGGAYSTGGNASGIGGAIGGNGTTGGAYSTGGNASGGVDVVSMGGNGSSSGAYSGLQPRVQHTLARATPRDTRAVAYKRKPGGRQGQPLGTFNARNGSQPGLG